jgi:two-component system, NtrC family, nitrogen regulation response regulator NtrX
LSIDKVIVSINNALNFRRLEEENRYLRRKALEKHSLTGSSPTIMELKNQIFMAAAGDKWIFITGENGTGKELAARTIHQLSSRANAPMIDVNCAALSESLMDIELFGSEKGAVAGQAAKKIGKLELADNGTLFFDEIADMSPKIQGKLLRVFQEQKFERIGGSRFLDIKARVIASTNKDIKAEIDKGNFREDLYYRLNVIPIHVPPLRKRAEDIPLLIGTFLKESEKSNRKERKSFSPEAIEMMCGYPWPGNVRELKNFVERLILMTDKDIIESHDVASLFHPDQSQEMETDLPVLFSMKDLKSAKKAFEKEYLRRKQARRDH